MKKHMAWFGVLTMLFSVAALADTYKVDPAHTTIVFRIGHLGVSHVNGRFNSPSGTVEFDPAAPEKTSFDVKVEATSIDTGNQQRDTHLRSKDFFDVQQFPTIAFKSTAVRKTGEKALEVTGDMTLHGITKPMTVTLNWTGPATDPRMGTRAGFEAVLTVKRSDFGMKTMYPAVGDEVRLTVDIEGVKQ